MSENSGYPFINSCCAFIFYQPMIFFLATRATRFRRKEKKRGALGTRMGFLQIPRRHAGEVDAQTKCTRRRNKHAGGIETRERNRRTNVRLRALVYFVRFAQLLWTWSRLDHIYSTLHSVKGQIRSVQWWPAWWLNWFAYTRRFHDRMN